MNKITITVSGQPATGKTRFTRWLAAVLTNMGITVKLIDESKPCEPHPSHDIHHPPTRNFHKSITIISQQQAP